MLRTDCAFLLISVKLAWQYLVLVLHFSSIWQVSKCQKSSCIWTLFFVRDMILNWFCCRWIVVAGTLFRIIWNSRNCTRFNNKLVILGQTEICIFAEYLSGSKANLIASVWSDMCYYVAVTYLWLITYVRIWCALPVSSGGLNYFRNLLLLKLSSLLLHQFSVEGHAKIISLEIILINQCCDNFLDAFYI